MFVMQPALADPSEFVPFSPAAKLATEQGFANQNKPTITGTLRDAWWCGDVLHGLVYGDVRGRFRDGTAIHTSPVRSELAHNVFATLNSVYQVESWIEGGGTARPASIPKATGAPSAPKRHLTYEQGIEELRHRFHKMRVTKDVSVDPEALHAVIYGQPAAGVIGHAAGINALVAMLHGKSTANGWWVDPKTGHDLASFHWFPYVVATKLMLTVSELAEGMEGSRKGLMDDKLPHRPMLEVELADAVIRICDLAGKLGYDLGGAIVEKTAFNDSRPDHKMEARQAAGGKAY